MNKDFPVHVKNTLAAHKKKICALLVIIALLGGGAAGVHAMFTVNGIVTGIGDNSITVTNFFGTHLVDLSGSPVNVSNIKIGDKIKICKNLQGTVYYVRTSSAKHHHRHND